MLRAHQLEKSFSAERVLKGVTLTLEPGELAGLIGASGSGKTVLARCMTGLETFTDGWVEAGTARLRAHSEVDAAPATQLRRIVGLVSQVRALPPYRTALELVTEGPRYVLEMPADAARAQARTLLTSLGLQNHEHKYPSELSGGQLTRLCLARAMAMRPKYLLCDEVTANLDPVRAAEVGQLLVGIAREGLGVLFISHQFDFLRRYANTVHYLHDGEVVVTGSSHAVLDAPEDQRLQQFLDKASLGR